MIDLNYRKPSQPRKAEPEEIAVAVLAVIIWAAIVFGIGVAL